MLDEVYLIYLTFGIILYFYSLYTTAFSLPADVTLIDALHRVLQLVDVGSKRFLTNKVCYL